MIKTPLTKTIVCLIVLTGVIQYLFPNVIDYMALSPREAISDTFKYVINLITYMFVHLSVFHLLSNTIFLYFFGTILEERIGSLKFGLVFLITGITAGFVFTISTLITSASYGVVGASGAALGVFACLVLIAPELNVYIMFTKLRITHTLYILTTIYVLSFSAESIGHITGILSGSVIGYSIKHLRGII